MHLMVSVIVNVYILHNVHRYIHKCVKQQIYICILLALLLADSIIVNWQELVKLNGICTNDHKLLPLNKQ